MTDIRAQLADLARCAGQESMRLAHVERIDASQEGFSTSWTERAPVSIGETTDGPG
jgi:hypothetical protein